MKWADNRFLFYKNANQLKAAVIWTLFEHVSRILNSSRTVRFIENNRPNSLSLSSKQNKVILNIANDKYKPTPKKKLFYVILQPASFSK